MAAAVLLHGLCGAADLACPSDPQIAWHEQERIQFVCLDPCTWQGREYDNHTTPLSAMALPDLDVEQWCAAAELWGAREILLVCKHVGGFCWWPTETTDYCVRGIPWKNGRGNLLADVARACRRRGLALGLYVYPDDPRFTDGIGRSGKTDDPARQDEWNALYRKQWEEVLTIAGADLVREVWFDGGCRIPMGDVFERLAPNAVLFGCDHPTRMIRWVGNEAGVAPDPNWNSMGQPDGRVWAPVECDTPLYDHNWFWSVANERKRKSVDHLLGLYVQSVGRGSVLLLNSTPNTRGLIPEDDMATYRAFGEAIDRVFGHPVGALDGSAATAAEIAWDEPKRINCSDLWEDFQYGHRIRAYRVEGRVDGVWVTLAAGSAVGRRKIDMFQAAMVDRVRLKITEQVGEPMVRRFRVHCVPDALAGKHLPAVSRGCVATASTVHSPPYAASFLVDGNPQTRWGTADRDPDPWVALDLGRPRPIARAAASELADRVRHFQVEVRRRETDPWRTVLVGERIGRNWQADFDRVTARFVRFHVLAYDGPGVTLWELQLYDRPEAWESVCAWSGRDVEADLSAVIGEPGRYEIQFVSNAGTPMEVERAKLFLEGLPASDETVDGVGSGTLEVSRSQAVTPESKSAIRVRLRGAADARGEVRSRPVW